MRLIEFTQQFGGNGLVQTLCTDHLGPALQVIGERLSVLIGPSCVSVWSPTEPGMPGVKDCSIVDHTNNGSGVVDMTVPSCAESNGAVPCWELLNDPMCAPAQVMNVRRDPNAPEPLTQSSTVACSLCVAGVTDASRGCP